ncbi:MULTISPECIES: flagellar hook-associated protein FlgL [Arthrobacter]|uniref:Flagellar hook-associated protein FlgL n=2 Tax=Arthrobacter TaxID=1663 RepID=A0ABU9KIC0_9MICC|nr:flagellar hook-associated protein FlgL [Arthrobacter sp. YJM1]MDP5226354.1 flagellar hook-associated protein FlgL [Arthrobacter sp. YJM1]
MMLRVTDQTMTMSAQRSLAASQARLAAAQAAASSGQRIGRPSDDPVGAGESLRVRAQIAAASQHQRNIDDGTAWLTTLDSALGSATGFLRQVRDLAVQGGNGSLNQNGRDALATQIDSLRKDLLGAANTRYLGRNIFAGSSDAPAAFTDGAPPTYSGTPGDTVQRRISPEQTVRVDGDGAAVFGTGADSVFGILDAISADLRNGVDPTGRLQALDAAMNRVVAGRVDAGARLSGLQRAGTENMTERNALEQRRSGIEDLDLGKAVLDLQVQQTNYQAALAITAKVLQPSLTDFLR